MSVSLEDLHDVKQEADENEEQYRKCFKGSIFSCGNFHSEEEKITLDVDVLLSTTNMVVAHNRDIVNI